MRLLREIVTDDQVEEVHANANFGPSLTKRDVVNQGVVTYAFGYTSGHTQLQILTEHGLVKKPKGYNTMLTKKGFEYLWALFRGIPLASILALTKPE